LRSAAFLAARRSGVNRPATFAPQGLAGGARTLNIREGDAGSNVGELTAWTADPGAWVALATLVTMEVVLGVDNLLFISILANKLPVEQRARARRLGIALALIFRLLLLGSIAIIVQLRTPVFTIFDHGFSWRDIILIGGGLFLVWKATNEIRHSLHPGDATHNLFDTSAATLGFTAAIVQIIALDLVFSVDSILTAVGMTDHVPIMVIAVLVAVGVMLVAAEPLANFINKRPTVVMLALGFLLMIGMALMAEGFGAHVPKGYIYAAMAFAAAIEALNLIAADRRARLAAAQRKEAA
jgi:predicted tellurium resistance membrane protein TerC